MHERGAGPEVTKKPKLRNYDAHFTEPQEPELSYSVAVQQLHSSKPECSFINAVHAKVVQATSHAKIVIYKEKLDEQENVRISRQVLNLVHKHF